MESSERKVRSYRYLVVWQKAVELVTEVYTATSDFPRLEGFGLTSQMRRCAVSVPSNIAEGQGRATKGQFIQFLSRARGSLFELETQLCIAGKLGYRSSERAEGLGVHAEEVGRILNGLVTSLGAGARRLSTNH